MSGALWWPQGVKALVLGSANPDLRVAAAFRDGQKADDVFQTATV